MLGYYAKSEELFDTKDLLDVRLKRGIALSGGSIAHYNFFKNLLTYSFWNESLNLYHHDTRCAQSLLFLYPMNIRIFIALLLYKEETRILDECSKDYQMISNINLPHYQIDNSNLISRTPYSKRIRRVLINLPDNFTLDDNFLRDIKLLLNVEATFSFDTFLLEERLEILFNIFNSSGQLNRDFLKLAVTNNRINTATIIANYLGYSKKSINIIIQGIELWQSQTLNI